MPKRSLILYASRTGNTEKVVMRFKQVLEKKGWECDLLKIDRKTNVKMHPSPFDCKKYDFLCVGSYVDKSLPSPQLIDIMRNNPQSIHYDPRLADPGGPPELPEEWDPSMMASLPDTPPPEGFGHRKTILGPESKKGIVFVTYSGHDFGPPEAVPALETLALEMAHLHFQCIGKFSCPGKFGNPKTEVWFKDINQRPHERDLLKAEIFLEEVLEEIE